MQLLLTTLTFSDSDLVLISYLSQVLFGFKYELCT